MKLITHHLIKFAIAAMVLTLLFRYSLSYGIETGSNLIVVLSAAIYAIGMFITGWTFGEKDSRYLPIYDVGFRFHLTTYIVHSIISELWFVSGFNSKYEDIAIIHTTAAIWGFFLLGHFVFFLRTRKNTINHLDKEDLFD